MGIFVNLFRERIDAQLKLADSLFSRGAFVDAYGYYDRAYLDDVRATCGSPGVASCRALRGCIACLDALLQSTVDTKWRFPNA